MLFIFKLLLISSWCNLVVTINQAPIQFVVTSVPAHGDEYNTPYCVVFKHT